MLVAAARRPSYHSPPPRPDRDRGPVDKESLPEPTQLASQTRVRASPVPRSTARRGPPRAKIYCKIQEVRNNLIAAGARSESLQDLPQELPSRLRHRRSQSQSQPQPQPRSQSHEACGLPRRTSNCRQTKRERSSSGLASRSTPSSTPPTRSRRAHRRPFPARTICSDASAPFASLPFPSFRNALCFIDTGRAARRTWTELRQVQARTHPILYSPSPRWTIRLTPFCYQVYTPSHPPAHALISMGPFPPPRYRDTAIPLPWPRSPDPSRARGRNRPRRRATRTRSLSRRRRTTQSPPPPRTPTCPRPCAHVPTCVLPTQPRSHLDTSTQSTHSTLNTQH